MKYIQTQHRLEEHFNQEYFETINYVDYEKRQKKYDKTALEIVEYFDLQPFHHVMDYGCATGMLMQSLRENDISVYGYDISEYALNQASKKKLFVSNNKEVLEMKNYHLTLVLDVFEHMFDKEIVHVLGKLVTDLLVVRLPCKLEGESDFHLEVSRKDPSHVNCRTEREWRAFFKRNGYEFLDYITTKTIYNSDGCFCATFKKKEEWTA